MRKLLWMIIFFGIYVWVMTSGHEQLVIQQGKNLYNAVLAWFEDAEVDFQVQQDRKNIKKRSRRWD